MLRYILSSWASYSGIKLHDVEASFQVTTSDDIETLCRFIGRCECHYMLDSQSCAYAAGRHCHANTCCSFVMHKQPYGPDCRICWHGPTETDCSCRDPLQTLYLSKNCLRSLQGIQQFAALVTLALADNLVDSFDQLEFLLMASQGHTLRALSLEGNPIARLPNYRSAEDNVACI